MPLKLGLTNPERLDAATREEFEHLLASLQGALTQQSDLVNELSASIRTGTFAELPAGLSSGDAGFRFRITDFGHEVVWDGSAWDFAPGDDGNGYFQDFAITPQQDGWAKCDGSATTYLQMGSTITAVPITPPNLTGYYRKTAAAYSAAPVAGSVSGQTGEVDDAGATADDMDIAAGGVDFGATFDAAMGPLSGSKFKHSHSGGSLSPDPPHVDVMTYFRR